MRVVFTVPDSQARVAAWLRRVGPFDPETAVKIALLATRELSAAAEPRKLTPESVALEKQGDVLHVSVNDAATAPPTAREAGHFLSVMLSGVTDVTGPIRRVAPWIEPSLADVVDLASSGEISSLDALVAVLHGHVNGELVVRADALEEIDAPGTFEDDESPPGAKSAVDPLLGALLDDRYRVVRLLGQGGMGAVYEVTTPDGARAAAKIITRGRVSDQTLRRFFREARAGTSIEHPHVVRTLELSHDRALGAPFLVMEMLEGQTLSDIVAERAPIDPPAIVRLFVDAARGVAAAHARGVVHRDIKPANLFLESDGSGAITIKVLDFGIAKRTASTGEESTTHDLTRTGGVIGSPAYMSPEQARNAKAVDARTDVWSLAASLYEALSGSRLFRAPALGELIVTIATGAIPRLAETAPWVPADLAAVVQRGLARSPDERWPSAEAFAEALEPFALTGEASLSDLRRVDDARRATSSVAPAAAAGSADATTASTNRGTWALAVAAVVVASVSAFVTIGVSTSRKTPAPAKTTLAADTALATTVPIPSDSAAPAVSAAALSSSAAVASSVDRPRSAPTTRATPPRSTRADDVTPPPTPPPAGVKPAETW